MKKIFLYCAMVLLVFQIGGCKKSDHPKPKTTIVVAKLQTVPKPLFYNGTISPVAVVNVSSPIEGIVKQLYFKYGAIIQQGQPLLTIDSTKLQSDYRSALSDYLRAQEEYQNAQVNFQGTQALQKAQIISRQEFLSEKQQYDSTALAYVNARFTLEKLLNKFSNISTAQFSGLITGDVSTLNKVLAMQHNHLTIKAPQAGVVLAPEKDSNDGAGGDNANKDLHVGTQVKENQNLVSIGDLTGIATTVSVSEMVINQIKPGQAVTVTVTALPDMTLQGVVKSVGAQAQTSGDSQSNNANFPVNIVVPQITPQQRDLIRVGMSAQIQILLPNPPQIMLPITAVYQKNGMSMVKVLNAQGKPQEVPVMTGQTTLDQIAITQGIKAGDKVMVTTP